MKKQSLSILLILCLLVCLLPTAALANQEASASSGGTGSSSPAPSLPASASDLPSPYRIYIADGMRGGSVQSSKVFAYEGNPVMVSVLPEEGYELSALHVTDRRDKALSISALSNGSYSFHMPGGDVTLRAEFRRSDGRCPGDESCPLSAYADLDPGHSDHDGIHYCIENALMTGVASGSFAPQMTVTRAMIVTALWRMEGCPVVNYLIPFEDVPGDAWYSEAVRWAASEKIAEGYSKDVFAPGDTLTREQFAAILYRYEQSHGGGFQGLWMLRLDYNDLASISDWAYEAVCWMHMTGVVDGKPGKLLDPQGSLTRAEAAAMLYRYSQVGGK